MGRLRRARYPSAGLLPNWDLSRETPSTACSTVSSASISTPSSAQLGGVYVGYPPSPTSSWRRVLTLPAPPPPAALDTSGLRAHHPRRSRSQTALCPHSLGCSAQGTPAVLAAGRAGRTAPTGAKVSSALEQR